MRDFFKGWRRKVAHVLQAITPFCNATPDSIPRTHCDDLEGLGDRAKAVMQLAKREAQRFVHDYVCTEHILLALLKERSGIAFIVLTNLEVDWKEIRLEVEKAIQPGRGMVTIGKIPLTPRAKMVIAHARDESRNLNHALIDTEHLLMGLIREEKGVAATVLVHLGLNCDKVREVMKVRDRLNHPDI